MPNIRLIDNIKLKNLVDHFRGGSSNQITYMDWRSILGGTNIPNGTHWNIGDLQNADQLIFFVTYCNTCMNPFNFYKYADSIVNYINTNILDIANAAVLDGANINPLNFNLCINYSVNRQKYHTNLFLM